MGWSIPLDRLAAKYKGDMDKTVRAATILVAQKVVMRTPVDTGRLRANWMFGDGSINSNTTESTDQGLAVLANLTAQINASAVGGRTYISNSLPYAQRIEYEGYSKVKAPQGMVRISLAEMPAAIDRLVKG